MTFKERMRNRVRTFAEALHLIRPLETNVRALDGAPGQNPRKVAHEIAGTMHMAGEMAKTGNYAGAVGELGESIRETIEKVEIYTRYYSALHAAVENNDQTQIEELETEARAELKSIARSMRLRTLEQLRDEVGKRYAASNQKYRERNVDEKLTQMREHLETARRQGKYDEVEVICTYLLGFPAQVCGGKTEIRLISGENKLKKGTARIMHATSLRKQGKTDLADRTLEIAFLLIADAGKTLAEVLKCAVEERKSTVIGSASRELLLLKNIISHPELEPIISRRMPTGRKEQLTETISGIKETADTLAMYVTPIADGCAENRELKLKASIVINLLDVFSK